jgi:hypothetical protein
MSKNKIYRPKPAKPVRDLLPGVKSGKKFGKK